MRRFLVCAVFLSAASLSAQTGGFEWKLTGESGYFHSTTNDHLRSLSALMGSAQYSSRGAHHLYSLQLRARPEIMDADHRMASASMTGWYRRLWPRWQAGVLLSARDQRYDWPDVDLDIQTLQGQGSLTCKGWSRLWIEGELRSTWTSSEATAENVLSSNAAFVRGRYFYSGHGSVSWGGFTERFHARTDDILTLPNTNRGWRNGAEFRFDYTRLFLVNIHYLVSWRTSRWTRGRSAEHEFNIVAGRSLGERWTIFLLAEYYFRQIGRGNQISRNLLYANSNYDNRIYVKCGYDVKSDQMVFLKLSHLRNKLIQEKTQLTGTHLALGYEIKL